MNKEQALSTIRGVTEVVGVHNYTSHICDPAGSKGMFGILDHKPTMGKVLAVEDNMVIVRNGRKSAFSAFDASNMDLIPHVGDTVKVTPYERRYFDGRKYSEPLKHADGISSTIIGEQKSNIPGVPNGASQELMDMVYQLTSIPADARRRITNVLIDAGAWKEPVQIFDLTDDAKTHLLPKLVFHIEQENQKGKLSVTLDRAADAYVVALEEDGKEPVIREDCYFDDLSSVINKMIVHNDDWLKDRVEIIKKAPKKKAS